MFPTIKNSEIFRHLVSMRGMRITGRGTKCSRSHIVQSINNLRCKLMTMFVVQSMVIRSQKFSNFNVFTIRPGHLRPIVQKQANFCESWHKLQTEIECSVPQLYKSQFFAIRFLCPSSSKLNLTVLLNCSVF